MANRFRGQVAASVDGQDYTLVLDWNALARFETLTSKNAMDVIQAGGSMSFNDTRAIVWAAMHRHHPDATLEDAGDLLSEDMGLVAALINAASPAASGNGKAPVAKKAPARR
jgi:hypothetical protein